MNEHREGVVGIEIQGTYDGVLFWFYPKTCSYRMRFDFGWYKDNRIDILSVMGVLREGEEK